MKNSNQINALNEVLSRCYDAEHGYREASKIVEDKYLASVFRDISDERLQFSINIITLIRSLGGQEEPGETLAAKIHQTWMKVRNFLTSNNQEAMLNEIIRGEEYALETYNNAIAQVEPTSTTFSKLVSQRNQVRTAITKIKQLVPAYES